MTKLVLSEVESSQSVCGSCIHHKTIPQFEKVCEKLGIGPFHHICEKYQFNWKLISLKDENPVLKNLTKVKEEDLIIMADFLRAERLTRRKGYRYKMPVYVKMFGEDYLSNYAKAWVITAQRNYVYVQGKNSSYYGAFLKKSILKEPVFLKKSADLIVNKKIKDPKFSNYTKIKIKNLKTVEDIPTIDKFLSNTMDKIAPKGKRKNSLSYSIGEADQYVE